MCDYVHMRFKGRLGGNSGAARAFGRSCCRVFGRLFRVLAVSQKGHRRAKIREHRCKQQMPLMGMARNYDDPEGSFHE